MKAHTPRFVIITLLLAVTFPATAQTTITKSVLISFPTGMGTNYQLQTSANLANWTVLEQVEGHGLQEVRYFTGTNQAGYYRVLPTNAPVSWLPPATLMGMTLETAGHTNYFVTFSKGVAGGDIYDYTFQRTSDTTARLTMFYPLDNWLDAVDLKFVTPSNTIAKAVSYQNGNFGGSGEGPLSFVRKCEPASSVLGWNIRIITGTSDDSIHFTTSTSGWANYSTNTFTYGYSTNNGVGVMNIQADSAPEVGSFLFLTPTNGVVISVGNGDTVGSWSKL